jgi:hypothetical protein
MRNLRGGRAACERAKNRYSANLRQFWPTGIAVSRAEFDLGALGEHIVWLTDLGAVVDLRKDYPLAIARLQADDTRVNSETYGSSG